MKILAIDTTTKAASVAILNNNKITMNSISNEITHSEKLLPLIDTTLTESSLKLKDIDMYAVINGPGSFTGIRIGLSTLKAFSMIDNLKIFSLSATSLISYVAYKNNINKLTNNNNNNNNNNKTAYILSLIDARNDRVYYSFDKLCLNNDNKIVIQNIIKISNDLIDDTLNIIKNNSNYLESLENIIIAGNCVNKYSQKLTDCFQNAFLNDIYPTPSDLISAYQHILDTDMHMYDTYTLDAVYARESQAERLLKNEK